MSPVLSGFSLCGEPHLARKAYVTTARDFLSTKDKSCPKPDRQNKIYNLFITVFIFQTYRDEPDLANADLNPPKL